MKVLDVGPREADQKLSKELFGRVLTPQERQILVRVSRIVSRRSARIAAALIVGALTRVERRSAKHITVAVDGSLFEKYPQYSRRLAEAIRELEGAAGKTVRLKLTKDGSGIGAAVIAAVVNSSR